MPMNLYENFLNVLDYVAGKALAAARYSLHANPMHHARGLFRFHKSLADGAVAYIEFQVLHYQQGKPSRFCIQLLRNRGGLDARDANAPDRLETTLSALLWEDFGLRVLPDPNYWWVFHTDRDLGFAIGEAGKLLFAFGIPWLEGTLKPESDSEADIRSAGIP